MRSFGPPVTERGRDQMTKWEYQSVALLSHATKQILDGWGDDGWELVSVVPAPLPEGADPRNQQYVAYMKRAK